MAALVIPMMCSCVKERSEDCPDPRGNVHLTVSVDASASSRAVAGDYLIERAHVYVFDNSGGYVTSADVEGARSDDGTGEYHFWLTLPAGDYDFVAWTNHGEYYRTNRTVEELEQGGDTMSDLELRLEHGEEPLTDHIPDLLHGITRAETILDHTHNSIEVEIVPKTYTVNLTALNLPASDDEYTFTITDNNSHYNFEGDIIEEKPYFTHSRSDTAPGGEFNASIRTLTLSAERHPRFSFTNTTSGVVMHDADLITTITRAYAAASRAVDFTSTYTYDILLSFDATTMDFSVSVNGWEHDERYEILD